MAYTARQIVTALAPILNGDHTTGIEMLTALAAVLPGVTVGEFKAGFALHKFECEIADAEDRGELAYLARVKSYMAAEPETATAGTVLRKHAEAGDLWAKAQVKAWDSPDHRAYLALATAAATLHPDWHVQPDGALRWKDGLDDHGGDIDVLIDWLQITHPEIAKAVEDRARAGHGVN